MDTIKVGDIAAEPASGTYGIVTDINSAGRARLAHGHKETRWVAYDGLEHMDPPEIGGGYRFGQFVKRSGKDQVGMMLKFSEGRYTMLCADAKCYPKGTKFVRGHWYRAADIAEVSEAEKELFRYKLDNVHAPEEYAARLERTRAEWTATLGADPVKRFDLFWGRLLAAVGDEPGVTWGSRLRTMDPPSPSLNFRTDTPEEFQSNMFCFFTLTAGADGPNLSVFIKKSSWIPEAARGLYPAAGDKQFYVEGHLTGVALNGKTDEELLKYADALAAIYKAAGGTK